MRDPRKELRGFQEKTCSLEKPLSKNIYKTKQKDARTFHLLWPNDGKPDVLNSLPGGKELTLNNYIFLIISIYSEIFVFSCFSPPIPKYFELSFSQIPIIARILRTIDTVTPIGVKNA